MSIVEFVSAAPRLILLSAENGVQTYRATWRSSLRRMGATYIVKVRLGGDIKIITAVREQPVSENVRARIEPAIRAALENLNKERT